ncbi:MAG: hypothetical protein L6V93_01645 [Clostridiales bacterium]|nr:MAG: hypothetical protein L6V93_01645 [Clostridiales bacterium]
MRKIILVSEKSIPILLSSYGSISDSVTGVLANDYDDKELMKEKNTTKSKSLSLD